MGWWPECALTFWHVRGLGQVMQGLISHDICSITILLPDSSRPINVYTVWNQACPSCEQRLYQNFLCRQSARSLWSPLVSTLWFLHCRKMLWSLPCGCPSLMDVCSKKTFGVNPTFMDVVDMRVPTYNNNAFVCNHRYKPVVASRLGLALGTVDMRVLMRDQWTAACQQSRMYQFFSCAVLQASLDAFGAISQATWFCLSSSFTV